MMEQDFKDFMFVFLSAKNVLRSCAGMWLCRRLFSEDEEWGEGQLLSAVGLDPNNNIFPIVFCHG